MLKLLYYIFIVPLSWTPFPLLYIKSDVIAFLLGNVIGYRKEVITNNLINSFPDKSSKEIKQIRKAFYKHFCDLFLESLKLISIKPSKLKKRFTVKNPELLNKLYQANKSVLLVCGHYGNWEWLASLPNFTQHKVLGLYKVQKSKFANTVINNTRSKFGLIPVPMENVMVSFVEEKNNTTLMIFVGDQSPRKQAKVHWTQFMNQGTAVLKGTEKFAQKFDHAVVYLSPKKVKRGFYEVELKLITDNAAAEEPGYITEQHTRLLENDIKRQPHLWLWSHRRWKHKKEDYAIT